MTTQAVARRWQRNVTKARKLPRHLPVLSAIDSAGLRQTSSSRDSRELCDEGHSSGFKPWLLSRGKQGKGVMQQGPGWFICYSSLWCAVQWWRSRRQQEWENPTSKPLQIVKAKSVSVIWMNQVGRTGFPLYFVVVSIRKCFNKLGNDIYNNKKEYYEAVSV